MRVERSLVVAALAVLGCTAPPPEPRRAHEQAPSGERAPASSAAPQSHATAPERRPDAATPSTVARPACVPAGRPLGSLELVRQQPLESPPDRFSPDGRFAAVGDCEVWAIDGEVYLGEFGQPRASGDCVTWPGPDDPCADWPELIVLDLDAIRPLRGEIMLGSLKLSFEDERVRGFESGAEAFVIESEQPFVAAALSRDRTRLALAREDAIEVFSVANGKRLAVLRLDRPKPPGAEVWKLALTWSGHMPVALIGRTTPCDQETEDCPWGWHDPDQAIWELRRWPDLAHDAVIAELVTWEGEDDPAWVHDAQADPLGRWLWLGIDSGPGHDLPWERRQISLRPEADALAFDLYETGIDGEPESGLDELGVDERSEASSSWVTGARTARVWKFTASNYDGEGSGSDDLWWGSMQLWPRPVRKRAHLLASDSHVEEQSSVVLGVADDRALVSWSHCWPDTSLERLVDDYHIEGVGPDRCKGERRVPPGCVARGVDDQLAWLLVECGSSWRLLPVGPAAAALAPVELADADDGRVTAMFGRSGLAIASERGGLKLMGPDASPRAQAPAVTEIVATLLDAELDRVVGRSPTGLAVFDLATGASVASLALEQGGPITHAAFAPDGRRLAWTDGRRISVWELDGGEMRRWDAGSVLGLAWRQDGAVVFSGGTRALPERAWDPATGQLALAQPDPRWLERLADADLDPTWRWAFEGDDVILRTVDGLALYLERRDWVVTETGLYDGDGHGPSLYMRVIGDATPRVLEIDALPDRLRHPNLLADFIAGVALPEPRLDTAELAALE